MRNEADQALSRVCATLRLFARSATLTVSVNTETVFHRLIGRLQEC